MPFLKMLLQIPAHAVTPERSSSELQVLKWSADSEHRLPRQSLVLVQSSRLHCHHLGYSASILRAYSVQLALLSEEILGAVPPQPTEFRSEQEHGHSLPLLSHFFPAMLWTNNHSHVSNVLVFPGHFSLYYHSSNSQTYLLRHLTNTIRHKTFYFIFILGKKWENGLLCWLLSLSSISTWKYNIYTL